MRKLILTVLIALAATQVVAIEIRPYNSSKSVNCIYNGAIRADVYRLRNEGLTPKETEQRAYDYIQEQGMWMSRLKLNNIVMDSYMTPKIYDTDGFLLTYYNLCMGGM